MKELLLKLFFGVQRKDLTKKELADLEPLLKADLLDDDSYLKLHKSLRVCTVDIPRSSRSVAFLQQLGVTDPDIPIHLKNLGNARNGDLVVVRKLFPKKKVRKVTAQILYIAARHSESLLAYLTTINGKVRAFDVQDERPVEIAGRQKALSKLPEGTVVKLDPNSGEITQVMGVVDDPKVDEAISLALFNRPDEFTSEAVQEAKSHGDKVDKSMYPERTDLTHLPFVTIDPPDAKDFDDAIYYDVQKSELYVAIADVSEYVSPGGPIDKEARTRGFTVYFPHRSVPMIPRPLSENICSLKPETDRLSFVFKMKIDTEKLELGEYELFDAVIHSKRRYTYDYIDELMEKKREPDQRDQGILPWLDPLTELTKRLRKKRLRKGFDFSNVEIRLEMDDHLRLTGTTEVFDTLSHKIIEECMLMANKAAASMIETGIFRVHEKPDERSMKNLVRDLASLGLDVSYSDDVHKMVQHIQQLAESMEIAPLVDKMIIKSLKRAEYNIKNLGHFGLGFASYTHFTSPIRRYSDLILHRLLKAVVRDDEKQERFVLKNMEQITVSVSELEREAAKTEMDFKDRVYARWAANNLGQTVHARVESLGERGRDMLIKTVGDIKGARIFVPDELGAFDLFDEVIVRIIQVNVISTRIVGVVEGRVRD